MNENSNETHPSTRYSSINNSLLHFISFHSIYFLLVHRVQSMPRLPLRAYHHHWRFLVFETGIIIGVATTCNRSWSSFLGSSHLLGPCLPFDVISPHDLFFSPAFAISPTRSPPFPRQIAVGVVLDSSNGHRLPKFLYLYYLLDCLGAGTRS